MPVALIALLPALAGERGVSHRLRWRQPHWFDRYCPWAEARLIVRGDRPWAAGALVALLPVLLVVAMAAMRLVRRASNVTPRRALSPSAPWNRLARDKV